MSFLLSKNPLKRSRHLPEKIGWEILTCGKAKGQIFIVTRPAIGPEDKVPDAKRNSIVKSIGMSSRHLFGAVPQVHLRSVEQILERPQVDLQVGMTQLPSHQRENMHDEKICDTKTDHGHRNISFAAESPTSGTLRPFR